MYNFVHRINFKEVTGMLRLNDVRLRGCGFTLFPAAKEFGVSDEIMHNILTSLNEQLGSLATDFDAQEEVRKANPEFPQVLHGDDYWLTEERIEEALEADLLKETDGGYVLTDTSIKVFERAAAIQNELDNQGFHCCPCHGF